MFNELVTQNERKIINYIKLNQDRNRKLTRNNLARGLKSHIYLIYGASNGLNERGYVSYEKVNKVESILRLTIKGERLFLEINSTVII